MKLLGYLFITFLLTLIVNTWPRIDFVLSWLMAINLVAFFVYRRDKQLAQKEKWRIAERVLLGLALFGGTPGAILAIYRQRHKIHKKEFLRKFWPIVMLHLFLLAVLLYLIASELHVIG